MKNTSFTCAPTKVGRHKANKASKRLKPKWWSSWSDSNQERTLTHKEKAKRRKKSRMAKASRKANR